MKALRKVGYRISGAVLGWGLVLIACITNIHRVIILVPLWGLAWLGDKADIAEDKMDGKLPVLFENWLNKWYEFASEITKKGKDL